MDKGLWEGLGRHLNGEKKKGVDQRTLSMHMRDAMRRSMCEVYYHQRRKSETELPGETDHTKQGGFENIGPEGF